MLLLTIPGCTTTGSGAGTDKQWAAIIDHRGAASFCAAAEPLRWSRNDTPETVRQAKEHNAVGKELCGW